MGNEKKQNNTTKQLDNERQQNDRSHTVLTVSTKERTTEGKGRKRKTRCMYMGKKKARREE